MKVNIPLELSETDLRKVRAGINRSGLATRKEIRIFVDRVVRKAITDLPEPKVRRKLERAATVVQSNPEPDDACANCDRPFKEHMAMGGCQLSKTYRRMTRFKAVTA